MYMREIFNDLKSLSVKYAKTWSVEFVDREVGFPQVSHKFVLKVSAEENTVTMMEFSGIS